jgi:membrane dipeptidase
MDRRQFICGAGALAMFPRAPRAQPQRLRYADMHSHVGMFRQSDLGSLREAMDASGMLLVARKYVSDSAVIRLTVGGFGAFRAPMAGELSGLFDRYVPEMRERHRRDQLVEVAALADLERVLEQRVPAVALAAEGADFLEGDLGRLAAARAMGLVQLQLVHYRVSEVGDICTERPVHGGLSAFGKEVVAACNRLGILVDVAHATSAGIEQALDISSRPMVYSHGHVASYEPSYTMDGVRARAVHLPVARKIAAKGGVVGVWPLGSMYRSLGAMAGALLDAMDKLGPLHVGVGSDMAGMPSSVIPTYAQFPELAEILARRGLKGEELDGVLGMNFVRVLRQSLAT